MARCKTLGFVTLLAIAGMACGDLGTSPHSETVSSQTQAVIEPSGVRAYGSIAQGWNHGCALARNGAVYCGGDNQYGELGDGTTTNRNVPVPVSGLTNQVFVSAGNTTTCSVGADGSVRCWGLNTVGQVGNGKWGGPIGPKPGYTWGYDTPQQVMVSAPFVGSFALYSVLEVAVGGLHACARDASGDVWCWGDNVSGQLGLGTTTNSAYAAVVPGISDAIGLASGSQHTCALLANRTVACWGLNSNGQLGNGTLVNSPSPMVVPGLSNVAAITATLEGTCALLASGTVECWGANSYGQMGVGSASSQNQTKPAVVPGLSGVSALSHGGSGWTNCAVLASGGAVCWGYDADGETGTGLVATSVASPLALGATGGSPPNEIAMGETQGCARTSDGNYWCWGANNAGQLGNGTTTPSPVPVYNDIPQWISPGQRLTGGDATACVIGSALGYVYCWGDNSYGRVGDGTTTNRSAPTQVVGLSNVTAVAGGLFANCALRGDGTVWCWGGNENGELGSGTAAYMSSTPMQVVGLGSAVGIGASTAILSDGTLWAWGENANGEIGDGTTIDRHTPVRVQGLSNVVGVSSDSTHRCAILGDGSVWCWGQNEVGQVGDGTTQDRSTPVQVSGISNARAIGCGMGQSCAVRADGSVWCWGNTALATGGATWPPPPIVTPTQISGIYDAVAISVASPDEYAGAAACVIRANGTLLCWGGNHAGQVGNGTWSEWVATPTPVVGLSNVINIATALESTFAVRADGTLWVWGDTFASQNSATTPTQVPFSP